MGARRAQRRTWRRPKKSRIGAWTALGVVVIVAVYAAALDYSRPHVTGDRLLFSEYVRLVENGQVATAEVLDEDAYVVGTYVPTRGATPGVDPVRRYNVPLARMTQGNVLLLLVENAVPTEVDQQTGKRVASLATLLLPPLVIVLLFVYLIVSYRRGTGVFGLRSGAQRYEPGDGTATFDDVAGQEQAITELREIRDYLADPARYSAMGATVPKGILLYGPPGCGKTLLARALANEAGALFYAISGADFVELYVGVGAARVRQLFREARENAPAIVFIDEIDSIGRRRGGTAAGGLAGSREEHEQALNQILTAMDGFSPLEGLIVVGATNRPDVLDPALLRPGRFDRTIGLEAPDERDRAAILDVHARGKPLDRAADLGAIARRAVGLSGADLAGVMNEAALLAVRSGRPSIAQTDLEDALDRVLEAPERQRRLSMRGHTFGRSAASGQSRVTFADVAGLGSAMEELDEVRLYLRDPERFLKLGARPPRGFLLVGPPGCGKTLLARALAAEANAAFFSVAATELVEVFVGEGASRVRDLFAEARAAAPAIVFLDEIDAIGTSRAAGVMSGGEREQTLNQVLIELDGFHARGGITVLAATNRPELLDEALVRPGRFDRTVTIALPDRAARRAILELHARGKPLDPAVDLDALASITPGFSGAALAAVMNEAALLAARSEQAAVRPVEIEQAIERIAMGVHSAYTMSDDDRRIVAYHEMGHALVTAALSGTADLHRISLLARGPYLGMAWQAREQERLVHTRSALVERMAQLLGGRAAEELAFGEPASGAADDLRRVSDLARQMVTQLGMSKALGPLAYGAADSTTSARAAELIDSEVRAVVEEAYRKARAVLEQHRRALEAGARALMDRESLTGDEVAALIAHAGRDDGSPAAGPARAARARR